MGDQLEETALFVFQVVPGQLFLVFLVASRLHFFADSHFLLLVDRFERFSVVKSELPITGLYVHFPLEQTISFPLFYFLPEDLYVLQHRSVFLVAKALPLDDIARFDGHIPLVLVLPPQAFYLAQRWCRTAFLLAFPAFEGGHRAVEATRAHHRGFFF